MADWLANGYPNPHDFGAFRLLGEPFVVQASALDVLVLVAALALMLSAAIWLAGRLVAGRYAPEAGGAGSAGGRATTGDGG